MLDIAECVAILTFSRFITEWFTYIKPRLAGALKYGCSTRLSHVTLTTVLTRPALTVINSFLTDGTFKTL